MWSKNQKETIYLKWGISTGIGVALLAYLVEWVFVLLDVSLLLPSDTELNITFGIIRVWILSRFTFLVFYPIILLVILKKIDRIAPHMNKYSVALYSLFGIWVTDMVINSIVLEKFSFSTPGLLTFVVGLLVAVCYKISNKPALKEKNEENTL